MRTLRRTHGRSRQLANQRAAPRRWSAGEGRDSAGTYGLRSGAAKLLLLAFASCLWLTPSSAEALSDPLDPRRAQGDFDGDGLLDTVFPRPLFDCGKGRIEVRMDDGAIVVLNREDRAVAKFTHCHDNFGAAVAVGDFNGDNFDDLAVGAPGVTTGNATHAGLVHVFYGSPAGLTTSGAQRIHQNRGNIPGSNQIDDHFGDALAAGDFNCDGFDELVVGVPRKAVGSAIEAGVIVVLEGTGSGVSLTNATLFREGYLGVDGVRAHFNHWGAALAAGNYDGVGCEDLAVGVPGDDGAANNAGYVYVMHGSGGVGLQTAGDYSLEQGQAGIAGVAEAGDRFGWMLASGDFNDDTIDDLFVGVPGEQAGERPWRHLLHGDLTGLGALSDNLDQHPYDGCAPISDDLGRFPLVVEMAVPHYWIGAAAGDPLRFPDGTPGGGAWHDYLDAMAFWSVDNTDTAALWPRYRDAIDQLASSGVNDSATNIHLIGYVPYLGGATEPHVRELGGLAALDSEIASLLTQVDNYQPSVMFDPNGSYQPSWFAGWKLPGEWQVDTTWWRYRYNREIRRSIEAHSVVDRPMFAYIQNIDRPSPEWVYNIAPAWSPDHSYQPDYTQDVWNDVDHLGPAIELDPASNALKSAPANLSSVHDFYGTPNTWSSLQMMLDANGDQLRMLDDPTKGNYAELLLGGCGGEEYRGWSYHSSRLVREGAENAIDMQLANGQSCQQHRDFHMPDLGVNSHLTSAAHARHDLWSGMHQAWGLWLHNFYYVMHNGATTTVWDTYREGMHVLKNGGLRDMIVNGKRIVAVPTLSAVGKKKALTISQGDESLACAGSLEPAGYSLAMPAYTGIQASLVVEGNSAYLIVTNSIGLNELGREAVRYEVALSGNVASVNQVIGVGGLGCGAQPNNVICDTFDTVDARVYEIVFSTPPAWPPLEEGWVAERFNER